jgi:DNA-binding transcriptional LysR family regulator
VGENDDLKQTAADIDFFAQIYNYLNLKPFSSFQEIADHIGGGLTPQKISAFVERIEDQMGGIRLIDRRQKSKNNILTPEAHEVYKVGFEAMRSLRAWPTKPARDLVRIGAPNLLIQSVLPKILPNYRQSLVDEIIPIDIRIDEEPDIEKIVDKVAASEWDFALVWTHERKMRTYFYLKHEKNIVLDENCFGVEFDVVMICPPGHKFVKQAKAANEGRGHGNRWKLDLSLLADELVYVLPPQRQPLNSLIPIATDPKKRISQTTYMAIISMVRCHVEEGIGLVPSIYTELNEMMRKGQLFYAPVYSKGEAEKDLKVTVGCISRKGIANLKPSARRFFDFAKPKFREAATSKYEPESMRPLYESIVDYIEYVHCAFVMQDDELFGVPHWFRGKLKWHPHIIKDGVISGEFTAITTERAWTFDIEGYLEKGHVQRDRIFYFKGIGKQHKNHIICPFNILIVGQSVEQDALVGTWSGRDDLGLATAAPMVLSQVPLGLETIRAIVNRVSFRCLPNAETEFTGKAKTDD